MPLQPQARQSATNADAPESVLQKIANSVMRWLVGPVGQQAPGTHSHCLWHPYTFYGCGFKFGSVGQCMGTDGRFCFWMGSISSFCCYWGLGPLVVAASRASTYCLAVATISWFSVNYSGITDTHLGAYPTTKLAFGGIR